MTSHVKEMLVAARTITHQETTRQAIAREVLEIYEEDHWHFFNGLTEKTGSVPTQPMDAIPTFIFRREPRLKR